MKVDVQKDIQILRDIGLLDILLQDHTSGQNIIYASDSYMESGISRTDQIMPDSLSHIQVSALREKSVNESRARKHAEVVTPSWIVNDMCDNLEKEDELTLDCKVLEITCGEAPFLAGRYDMNTGKLKPVTERKSILDRKLYKAVAVSESVDEYTDNAIKSFQSVYGYDFQGDNVLIARVNLMMTWLEYMDYYWSSMYNYMENIAEIVSWNVWQMDGLTGYLPYQAERNRKGKKFVITPSENACPCVIKDWQKNDVVSFNSLENE